MSINFTPKEFTTVPTRTPAATLSLVRALLIVASDDPPPVVAARLAKLHTKGGALQSAWVELIRPLAKREDPRPYDNVLDRSWSVLRSRVDDWAQIGDEKHGERAAELVELVFPTGLDFLGLPFTEEWSESERRLALIKTDELEPELVALAGERFVAAVQTAHESYGAVLGITEKPGEVPDPARVIDSLREAQAAIASYARAVVGLTDEDDEQEVATTKRQLAPIVDFRKLRGSSEAAAAVDDEDPEAPLPLPPGGE